MENVRGFTLIEIMFAILIVGIVLPAGLSVTHGTLDGSAHINQKTYAYWLAQNKMQEMIITQKLQGNVTKTKKRQDTEEFAGIEWFWKIEMEETAVPKMFRMNILVGLSEDEPLANLSGFLHE